jgi:hypothetical protein
MLMLKTPRFKKKDENYRNAACFSHNSEMSELHFRGYGDYELATLCRKRHIWFTVSETVMMIYLSIQSIPPLFGNAVGAQAINLGGNHVF